MNDKHIADIAVLKGIQTNPPLARTIPLSFFFLQGSQFPPTVNLTGLTFRLSSFIRGGQFCSNLFFTTRYNLPPLLCLILLKNKLTKKK